MKKKSFGKRKENRFSCLPIEERIGRENDLFQFSLFSFVTFGALYCLVYDLKT